MTDYISLADDQLIITADIQRDLFYMEILIEDGVNTTNRFLTKEEAVKLKEYFAQLDIENENYMKYGITDIDRAVEIAANNLQDKIEGRKQLGIENETNP